MNEPKEQKPELNETNRFWARTDVIEGTNIMEFILDIPGASKEDVQVKYNDGLLKVEAHVPAHESGYQKLFTERESKLYRRAFRLPTSVDPHSSQAEIKDGVLHLCVPKNEESIPKTITVNSFK